MSFEREGYVDLLDLLTERPEEGAQWIERNISRLNLLQQQRQVFPRSAFETAASSKKAGGDSTRENSREHAADAASAKSVTAGQNAEEARRAGPQKSPRGEAVNAAILYLIKHSPRALSLNELQNLLVERKLAERGQVKALSSRLNRLKSDTYLDWISGSRSPDYQLTAAGSKELETLLERKLTADELNQVRR